MSYSFDGTNDRMTGTFTSTYNSVPVTLACYIKVASHPVAQDSVLSFGNSSTATEDSQRLITSATDDSWQCTSRDATTSTAATLASVNIDGVWAGYVGVFTAAADRDVYVQTISQTAGSVTQRIVANVMQFVRLGENFDGTNDFLGNIAEAAIWNAALTTQQITDYLAGVAASQIAPASLIGYWPLSASNATQANEGLDAGGDLTVTGATFAADHPTITSGLDPIRLRWRL